MERGCSFSSESACMVSRRQRVVTVARRCRPLAIVLCGLLLVRAGNATELAPGFRQLEGRHLTLVTDLPAKEDLDDLPQVFDAAFPQWCRYFGLDPAQFAAWHVTGYLMKSQQRFQQAGYWQADLPPFPNGYSVGKQFWIFDQTSPYYRRHLLLHEGVHSFMNMLIGGAGPPWYMEGMAELLATHRWQDGQLTVGRFPTSSREVLQLGRIEIIQDAAAAGHVRSLADILALRGSASIDRDAYGWTWGLTAFLDGHPRYRERFRSLPALLRTAEFEAGFRQLFADDWPQLVSEWFAFVANIDYGYDFERMAIDFRAGSPLDADDSRIKINADRGWQSSAVRLEAGKTYELSATGRYQVAKSPAIWWCEPGGVTIRYYHGQPLGILLATVVADDAPKTTETVVVDPTADPWATPTAIGLQATLSPAQDGTLYLRINESAADLADNFGNLEIVVREVPAKP
jgi:hypothetical protein